jgi:hypothetical protein
MGGIYGEGLGYISPDELDRERIRHLESAKRILRHAVKDTKCQHKCKRAKTCWRCDAINVLVYLD